MNCPRCRGTVPQGALFCPNCGNDLRAYQGVPQPQPSQPNVPYQAPAPQPVDIKEQMRQARQAAPVGYYQGANGPVQQRKSPLGWILGIACLAALAILGFFVINLLQKTGQESPGNFLAKQGQAPPPVLQKTGEPPPPVLADHAQAAKKMPADILRWLEHLERVERKRGILAQQGLASFMVMAQSAQFGSDIKGLEGLASGDPEANMPETSADKLGKSSADTKAEWGRLRVEFDSLRPPQECQTIADSYTHALEETGSMITDVMDALEASKEDPQKALQSLYGMKNQSGAIDQYGNETDTKVGSICDKYDTRKWFSISSDFGNSSILGSLGAR